MKQNWNFTYMFELQLKFHVYDYTKSKFMYNSEIYHFLNSKTDIASTLNPTWVKNSNKIKPRYSSWIFTSICDFVFVEGRLESWTLNKGIVLWWDFISHTPRITQRDFHYLQSLGNASIGGDIHWLIVRTPVSTICIN